MIARLQYQVEKNRVESNGSMVLWPTIFVPLQDPGCDHLDVYDTSGPVGGILTFFKWLPVAMTRNQETSRSQT